jgi:hypothetical protein
MGEPLAHGPMQGSTLRFSANPAGPGAGELDPQQALFFHRVIDLNGGDANLAQAITVHAAVIAVADPGNPDWMLRVMWSAFGWSTQADIDLVLGTTFTVFASSLSVDVIANGDEGGYAGAVGAFACYGNHPGTGRPPQRTLAVGEDPDGDASIPPGGQTLRVFIPAYARDLQVLFGTTGAAGDCDFAVRFDNATGSQISTTRMQNGIIGSQMAIPIPNDAVQAMVQNIDTTQTMVRPRLIFGLAL